MTESRGRREFMQLLGLGGVVFASGLAGSCTNILRKAGAQEDDFFFVQLSDSHWGFKGPPNPEAADTLRQAVAAVNALPSAPDFVVFTGDLTHTTDDPAERRRRLTQFRELIGGLKGKQIRLMPGEHDASLDNGEAYREFFGPTHYSFGHKGVHFIALDNVSDPAGRIGEEQLAWLAADLANCLDHVVGSHHVGLAQQSAVRVGRQASHGVEGTAGGELVVTLVLMGHTWNAGRTRAEDLVGQQVQSGCLVDRLDRVLAE